MWTITRTGCGKTLQTKPVRRALTQSRQAPRPACWNGHNMGRHIAHTYCQAPRPACQPSANMSAKFNTFMMASFTKLTWRSMFETQYGLSDNVWTMKPIFSPNLRHRKCTSQWLSFMYRKVHGISTCIPGRHASFYSWKPFIFIRGRETHVPVVVKLSVLHIHNGLVHTHCLTADWSFQFCTATFPLM